MPDDLTNVPALPGTTISAEENAPFAPATTPAQGWLQRIGSLFAPGEQRATYDSSEGYVNPNRDRNVPSSWGDAIGDLLGSLGNVTRARRNAETAALDKRWELVKDDPEAATAFLNDPNVPDWYKRGRLGNPQPGDFKSMAENKRRDLMTKLRTDLTNILDQAKTIQDPTERDQFIESRISGLRDEYPADLVSALNLPKGPDGHYIIPGVNPREQARTEETDAQKFITDAETRALKIQNPQARSAFMRERQKTFERLFPDQKSEFPQPDKDGKWSDASLGGTGSAADDILATIGDKFGGKVPSIRDYLQATNPTLLQRLEKGMGPDFSFILDAPLTEVWDTATHGVTLSKLGDYVVNGVNQRQNETTLAADFQKNPRWRALNARATLVRNQLVSAEREQQIVTSQLNVETDPERQKALKAKLDTLAQTIAKLNGQLDDINQKMYEIETTGDLPGGPPAGTTPSSGPAPSTPKAAPRPGDVEQTFRKAIQTQPRVNVLQYLKSNLAGLDPDARGYILIYLVNKGVITAAEGKDLNGGQPLNLRQAAPNRPTASGQPAPKVPTQTPVGTNQQAPGTSAGISQDRFNRQLAGFKEKAANPDASERIMGLTNLLGDWPKMTPAQRDAFQKAAQISPAERKWLDAGGAAGMIRQGVKNVVRSSDINNAVQVVRRARDPQARAREIRQWLVPLWSGLDPQMKQRIQKTLNLSAQEMSLLEGRSTAPAVR